jgi:hypothetical protein
MPATRFVILNHRVADGEHWDLMIELPEASGRGTDFHGLAAWQLADDPLERPREAIAATRLADHRLAYLEYEGPISGDRGQVRRVEEGSCEIIASGERTWQVRLTGMRLRGLYAITLGETGLWTFLRATETG